MKLSLSSDERSAKGKSCAAILITIEEKLTNSLRTIKFSSPVEFVYNPLEYAAEVHQNFLRTFMVQPSKKIMFLGMNPGPWGMVQNGVRTYWF